MPCSAPMPTAEDDTVRCWICLDDESLDDPDAGMIAPCACVGTNKWVHEACACRATPSARAANFFLGLSSRRWSRVRRPEDILSAASRDACGKFALAPCGVSHLQN